MLKADYFICPECGAEVRVGSKGCSKCASERATKSWEQDETYDGLDLPEEEFNYQDFIDEEFGSGKKRAKIEWFWWAIAVVLLLSLVAGVALRL